MAAAPPGSASISRYIDLTGDAHTNTALLPALPAPAREIRLDAGNYDFAVSLGNAGYLGRYYNVPGGYYYWRCYLSGTGVSYLQGVNYHGNCLLDPKWTDSFNIWLPADRSALPWRVPTGKGYFWESWLKKV